MTPADELLAAITVLRCDHKFPIQPPAGSLTKPGHCLHCGVSYRFEKPVADWLVEPLAAWLESWDGVEFTEQGALLDDLKYALTIARAINGGTP